MAEKRWRKKAFYLFIMAAAFPLVLSLFSSPSKLLARTESAEFCAQCHVMESEYESWIHSGAHRRKKCVDCHLPNDNLAFHFLWKTIDGVKDSVFFYSGKVPETIRISSHAEGVLKTNCVRCHETAVSMIDTERKCWNCHRNITHKRTGAIETL